MRNDGITSHLECYQGNSVEICSEILSYNICNAESEPHKSLEMRNIPESFPVVSSRVGKDAQLSGLHGLKGSRTNGSCRLRRCNFLKGAGQEISYGK